MVFFLIKNNLYIGKLFENPIKFIYKYLLLSIFFPLFPCQNTKISGNSAIINIKAFKARFHNLLQ